MSQYDQAEAAGSSSGIIDSLLDYEQKEPNGECKRWKEEIRLAQKELGDWWRQGDECENRYLDDRDSTENYEERFNIYTSNVQIMQSALYNAIPKVEVGRTFKDTNDDVARVAAIILQRVLQQDLDSPRPDFDPAMRDAIQNRLISGLGAAWLRLETTTQTITDQPGIAPPYEHVVDQLVRCEHVHFKDYLWSPCRTWEERRWIARRVSMTRDKLVARFGEEIGRKVPLGGTKKKATDNANAVKPEELIFKQAEVFEIWDREKRTVYWICMECDYLLDKRTDPLGITNFDPAPKPLLATTTTSRLVPTPDFVLWQDQYNALDIVNTRISLLVDACKVVGVYDRSSEGIQKLLKGNENTLIPVDNWSMFAEKGGIKGQVDWLPLDMVVAAMEQLRKTREDLKQQIYELTGIADIVRGATKASETLGAQELKAQFASVRIQSLQASIVDFAAEVLRIKGEIAARHFTPEILAKKANVQNLDEADTPLVPAALQLLKDPGAFQWRVSIQPDSMAQVDYAKQKQERVEFLGAVSTYMEKAVQALAATPQLIPLSITLLKFGISGFRVSKEIEGAIDKALTQMEEAAKNPPPKPPDPAMMKVQAEMQGMQAKAQTDQQAAQAKAQMDQQSAQADIQAAQIKARTDVATTMMKAHADVQSKQMKTRSDLQQSAMKTRAAMQQSAMKAAQQQAIQHAKAMDPKPGGKTGSN
jgi:hypothetical protein